MASSLKSWELENTVELVDPARDALYTYSETAVKALQEAKPYRKNPTFFHSIRISAIALLKMVMHARAGGSMEIMGLMTGYATASGEFVVTDAFRLPVEGTETRVNAQEEANEYMVQYLQRSRDAGTPDNAVGWYHSHPGYGCWLSGIDVNTQSTQQSFQDPFVAVVIDPDRTISAGKVEIGAFRTYPEGHVAATTTTATSEPAGTASAAQKPKDSVDAEGFQSIPVGKIEDFGAYSDRYYSLEVTHFKSSLDTRLLEALWHKYWVSTLASSPLFSNRDYGTKQMIDLAAKIRMADSAAGGGGGGGANGSSFSSSPPSSSAATDSNWSPGRSSVPIPPQSGAQLPARDRKIRDKQIEKIVQAGNKIAAEENSGLMAADVKEKLFSSVGVGVAVDGGTAAGATVPNDVHLGTS